jgi:hypothetical protein
MIGWWWGKGMMMGNWSKRIVKVIKELIRDMVNIHILSIHHFQIRVSNQNQNLNQIRYQNLKRYQKIRK